MRKIDSKGTIDSHYQILDTKDVSDKILAIAFHPSGKSLIALMRDDWFISANNFIINQWIINEDGSASNESKIVFSHHSYLKEHLRVYLNFSSDGSILIIFNDNEIDKNQKNK